MEREPDNEASVPSPEDTIVFVPKTIVPEPKRYSAVDAIYGIITHPDATLKTLTETPRPWWGIIAYTLVTLVVSADSLGALAATWLPDTPVSGWLMLLNAGITLLGWFIMVGCIHLVGEALGGRGSAMSLVTVLGFASIPSALTLPAQMLLRVLAIRRINWLISLAIGVWVLVLYVMAIRNNYRFSTGRAIVSLGAFALGIMTAVIGLSAIIMVLVLQNPLLRNLPRIPGLP